MRFINATFVTQSSSGLDQYLRPPPETTEENKKRRESRRMKASVISASLDNKVTKHNGTLYIQLENEETHLSETRFH